MELDINKLLIYYIYILDLYHFLVFGFNYKIILLHYQN